ncbi:uncharacterized protein LOC121371368 [Gigantopelta aegis]|uniref:uncharacterized protein LOC121371368 n=1 Tax=Gigantopelta aegis TaxID=1735272 RepID=UPI001B88B59B|nr:uncharacterized protein LOC121371368 [Gigantopelta aegis]
MCITYFVGIDLKTYRKLMRDEIEFTFFCSAFVDSQTSPTDVPASPPSPPRLICRRAVASPEPVVPDSPPSPLDVPAMSPCLIRRRAVASPEPVVPDSPPSPMSPRHRHADSTGNESSFNLTAGSIEMPEDVHENSIQDPSPMEVPLGPQEMAFRIIEKGTQRGKPLLVDSRGYTYTIQDGRKAPALVYWWCSVRSSNNRCRATVAQRNDTFQIGRHQHNHQLTVGLFTKKNIAMRLREVSREGDFYRSSHSMAEQIYMEESKPDELCPTLVPLLTAARTVNHHRQKLRPKKPKDLTFELEPRAIPEDFFREDIKTGRGSRHLVFATQEQLRTLTTAKTWFVDSTFRVVSKPFTQLLSIHAFLTSGGGR